MINWKIKKRSSDIRSNGLIEAICDHGVGHHNGVHGCDGCCNNMPKEIKDQLTHE